MKKTIWSFAAIFLFIFSFSAVSSGDGPRGVIRRFTADVMAPLIIPGTVVNDSGEKYYYTWDLFKSHLMAAKSIGVTAVSTDVWWGLVEKNQDQYDWSYYDELFKYITDAGLKIHPIMSFHSCGGNVGDTYNCTLPEWIWNVAGDGAKYVNELDNPGNSEHVALWAENLADVNNEYMEYMTEFQSHFAQYAGSMQEIDISCGPCGEWRYPSYDVYTVNSVSYGRGYPTRGYLYCYSDQALSSFRTAMENKYTTVSTLNQAWGTSLQSFEDVTPPENHDSFFDITDSKAYINGQYGKDFVDWYHDEMIAHGKTMLNLAINAFNGAFKGVPLGIKIPGVHWTAGGYDAANNKANHMPRSAEVCAGVVSSDFVSDVEAHGAGPGYSDSLEMVAELKQNSGSDIHVYFTCIDMANNDVPPAYSMASALVFGVGSQAQNNDIVIKGENALAPNNDSSWAYHDFWWNINNAMAYSSYNGVNILRIFNIVNDTQKAHYQSLINAHAPATGSPTPTHN